MPHNSCFDQLCPEAKLIMGLTIVGAIVGSVTGANLATSIANREAATFLFGALGAVTGLLAGKVIGSAARCAGLGFFANPVDPADRPLVASNSFVKLSQNV